MHIPIPEIVLALPQIPMARSTVRWWVDYASPQEHFGGGGWGH